MRGIDKFRERFAGHEGEYVLIGVSASTRRTWTWSSWSRR